MCINETIVRISYPLVIAGESRASTGRIGTMAVFDEESEKIYNRFKRDFSELAGCHCKSYMERLIPEINSNWSACYSALLYAVGIGVLDEKLFREISSWKDIYMRIALALDPKDYRYEELVEQAIWSAGFHGQEFRKWASLMLLVMKEKWEKTESPSYVDGLEGNGVKYIDTSKYGINDIAEVSILMDKLLNGQESIITS